MTEHETRNSSESCRPHGSARDAWAPRSFSAPIEDQDDAYGRDPTIRKLVEFFEAKTLAVLKQEDRSETWYGDWIAYQAEHGVYASVLSPRQYSTLGFQFDPLRFARFIEVFAYCSPAHGYSAQVTSLGLFAIMMGSNEALKREAVAVLEAGGLLAFAISERTHGADLLANEFTIEPDGGGGFVAGGRKFYIGNSNAAALIAVLARRNRKGSHSRRSPSTLIALRPAQSSGFRNLEKIRTLGVRSGHVGHFEVREHALPESDIVADGRQAWDAVLGAVTLGKFFLGFGSIGICEHALQEAIDHVRSRRLYGRRVIDMPHIRATMSQAYARLAAMKLYAFRALDYVHAAHADDRRYLLYCAVQKARVSTEGVKVMGLLSECIGARGFDAETYFEMALRDVQLVPGLESSTHINLATTAQFGPRYLGRAAESCSEPASLLAGEVDATENAWLFEARTGHVDAVAFPDCMASYRQLGEIGNVSTFCRQVERLRTYYLESHARRDPGVDRVQHDLEFARCLAVVAYAQLVAENAVRLDVDSASVAVMFHLLVEDLSIAALAAASASHLRDSERRRLRRVVAVPRTSEADWECVGRRLVLE